MTIAIYFDGKEILEYPLNEAIYYESYRDFAELAKASGDMVYFVRGVDSYRSGMRFGAGWQIENGQFMPVQEIGEVDVIYLKGRSLIPRLGSDDLAVNDPGFDAIACDKMATYGYLSEFMAPSSVITEENWQEVIGSIPTSKIVLKPLSGVGGDGILILEKEGFTYPAELKDKRYLAQPFVNTSRGIEGLTDGLHDLRIIMMNGEPKLSYLRIPRQGSFLANISQGASANVVDITDIPDVILDVARKADAKFSQFSNRFYTIDFMVEHGRPYICEINSQPGFPHALDFVDKEKGAAHTRDFHQDLLDVLKGALK